MVYPLLADESCFWVAADFDDEEWRDDVAAVRACAMAVFHPPWSVRVRAAARIYGGSSSNRFRPAWRDFAASVLTLAVEAPAYLASFDRLFPSQDTMPRKGFGNLIALPLQKQARRSGNSVFVDEAFRPYDDQWAYLASLTEWGQAEIEQHVARARRANRLMPAPLVEDPEAAEPWLLRPSQREALPPLAGPFPPAIEAVLGDRIYLRTQELPAALQSRLVRLATFQNPEFYRAQAMRQNTFGKPRLITCAEMEGDYLLLPRGCLDDMSELLSELGIELKLRDERVAGTPLDVQFHGTLRPDQLRAAQELLKHDTGVLSAGTAFGKTVIGAWMIAQRQVSTLVLVNTRQLQVQWVARLALLDLAKSIRRLGGGTAS